MCARICHVKISGGHVHPEITGDTSGDAAMTFSVVICTVVPLQSLHVITIINDNGNSNSNH